MCYMDTASAHDELVERLRRVARDVDEVRARASASMREAVGEAADRGLTQVDIAHAIGRSQPEVSRLVRAYRGDRFQPRSPLGKVLARRRSQVLALARRHKAGNVRVFGSVARGDDDESSDIDLLVDLAPDADLMDLAALDVELERLLGHPVDVVPARMLRPHVAPSALAEAIAL